MRRSSRLISGVARRKHSFSCTLRRFHNSRHVQQCEYVPTSSFLSEMHQKGYIHQATDLAQLDELMAREPIAAYIGFDATASSLHVGSLLQIMILRHLQKHGHKPIVVMGGGTTKVGDPSGKDDTRTMMDEDQIQSNIRSIGCVFEKFLTFGDGPTDAVIVDNATWLENFNYLAFLREYGPHFSVNRMLTFDSVRTRLDREQPLSFLEFNYMLLQSVDFVELNRRHGVRLQIGGSDQWGNIVSGVELGRRKLGGGGGVANSNDGSSSPGSSTDSSSSASSASSTQLFGLTAPLVVTSDGKKMGKSVDGAVWLDAALLPPYDYWQFWRNTADPDTVRFVKLFTDVPAGDYPALERLEGAALNEAKVLLADEATRMLHGDESLREVKRTVEGLFSSAGGSGGGGGVAASTAALPRAVVGAEDIGAGMPVVALFVELELCKSKAEAKRLIKGGGARINGEKIADEKAQLEVAAFGEDGTAEVMLSAGKKRHGIVVLG